MMIPAKMRLLLLVFLLIWEPLTARSAVELGIKGAQFTINGEPKFLFGISYYGACGASPETISRDLDKMRANGVSWVRVWANWSAFGSDVSAVDEEGRPREPYLSNLQKLASACDERGLIMDVTLTRGLTSDGKARLKTLDAHKRAIDTVVGALKTKRNWYLDLSNERNIHDERFTSMEDLKVLRAHARELAPWLKVTASHSPDITKDELKKYLFNVNIDFITPHRPRNANSPAETAAQTKAYFQAFKDLGRVVPILYQEPFRRGYTKGWNPKAADYLTDALAARDAGAAGWCLHNGDQRGTKDGKPRRSFDLAEASLFEQLDREELEALRQLGEAMRQ